MRKPHAVLKSFKLIAESIDRLSHKVWFDRKNLAKKAAPDARRSASATRGGLSMAPPLSQWELELSIMGDGFGNKTQEHQYQYLTPKTYKYLLVSIKIMFTSLCRRAGIDVPLS